VAQFLQDGRQFNIVEDFAVEDNPDVAGFVADGLLAPAEVDDAQAGAAQTDPAPFILKTVNAKLVWSAMAYGAEHGVKLGFADGLIWVLMEDTGNSAHICEQFTVYSKL
jgi:hypothetical protein